MKLSQAETKIINDYETFASYIYTWLGVKFLQCDKSVLGVFFGNQAGKGAIVVINYIQRILGCHPVARKNILYYECETAIKYQEAVRDAVKRGQRVSPDMGKGHYFSPKNVTDMKFGEEPLTRLHSDKYICPECSTKLLPHIREGAHRIIRFASQNMPSSETTVANKGKKREDGVMSETKNAQLVELLKWIPSHLLKEKKISIRDANLYIADPYNVGDIIIEFVSFSQVTQSSAGVQRLSTWCIAEGQRVLMSNGIWRNIEDIEQGDELVCESIGGYGSRQKVNKVKETKYMGEKPVYRYNCQKGISFETTKDHLVMIPKRGMVEYKRAGDLEVGDKVTCKLSNIQGIDTLEEWRMKLLGAFLGDGCGSKCATSPSVASKNGKIIKELEKVLPSYLYFRKQNNGEGTPSYFISSKTPKKNEFKDWLKELGLWGKNAGQKFIPDVVFTQSDKNIVTILSYLFSTDGWAYGHSVSYCSTSYRLTQDIYLLLRRLGIRSTISRREFKNNWNTQWWVNVSQARDVVRFTEKVGIICKEEALSKVVKEAKRRIVNKKKVCTFTDGGTEVTSSPLRQNVKIKSIEYVGIKKVYDIQMEQGGWDYREKNGKKAQRKIARSPRNNFLIQGGVVVHNCDELPTKQFFDEQVPRLLAVPGADLILSYTVTKEVGYMFDLIWNRARFIYRSKSIVDFFKKKRGEILAREEETDSEFRNIAVFHGSSYDNPTLDPDTVVEMMKLLHDDCEDDNVMEMRLFCIFSEISSVIHPSFNMRVHVIDPAKYFTNTGEVILNN